MTKNFTGHWVFFLAIMIVGFVALQIYLHIDLEYFKDDIKSVPKIETETPSMPNVFVNEGTPIDDPKDDPIQPIKSHGEQIAEISNKNGQQEVNTVQKVDKFDETNADVPVSPFGFGPFPIVPDGISVPPWEAHIQPNHELLTRVRIKLWKEGIKSDGATMENGLIYPTVRGRIYIQTNGEKYTDGSEIRYGRIKSHPDDDIDLLPDPSKFEIYTFEDGIDPYSYLNLGRKEK